MSGCSAAARRSGRRASASSKTATPSDPARCTRRTPGPAEAASAEPASATHSSGVATTTTSQRRATAATSTARAPRERAAARTEGVSARRPATSVHRQPASRRAVATAMPARPGPTRANRRAAPRDGDVGSEAATWPGGYRDAATSLGSNRNLSFQPTGGAGLGFRKASLPRPSGPRASPPPGSPHAPAPRRTGAQERRRVRPSWGAAPRGRARR